MTTGNSHWVSRFTEEGRSQTPTTPLPGIPRRFRCRYCAFRESVSRCLGAEYIKCDDLQTNAWTVGLVGLG